MSASETPARPPEPTLRDILGGRAGALDATIPVVAFVVAWLVALQLGAALPVAWAGGIAVLAAGAVAAVRVATGGRARSVLVSLLAVAIAALIAAYTGSAENFFLLQIASNAASALAWTVSIIVRWPLLGVVAGTVLGRRTRWRRDPALLRAYQRASWVWVPQYLIRLAVFLPLYAAGSIVGLGVARVVLSWPLIAATVALSWPVLRRSLPAGHPGILHPVVPGEAAAAAPPPSPEPREPSVDRGVPAEDR